MTLTLYSFPASPPVVSVKLLLKALNIDYKLHALDYNKKEHHEEFYLKMNPQHTAPVIDDNGFVIWDSHTINSYLTSIYGKTDDNLYPRNLQKRAVIDQRLHFDNGILFPCIVRIVRPLMDKKTKSVSEKEKQFAIEAYEFLEKFLSGAHRYIAGDRITIADFSIIPDLLSLNVLVPEICKQKYPLLTDYLQRCKENVAGYEEIVGCFLTEFTNLIRKYEFDFSGQKG